MKVRNLILIIIFVFFVQHLLTQESNIKKIKQLLSMSLEELMNVKITTAAKIPQKILEVPASSIIITREEIEKHGYINLEEILQNIPGFYGINDYSEGGMKFGVRGFWSGNTNANIIILINSIPQTKNVFGDHPLDQMQIPVGAIDRIEVVRGPMSIIYGSGAFFGAVNIITNGLNSSKGNNIVSIRGGSFNSQQAFLKITEKFKDLKLSFNISTFKTDGIDQPAEKLMSNPEILSNYGLSRDYSTGKSLGKNIQMFNMFAELKNLYLHLTINETSAGNHFSFPPFSDGHKNTWIDANLAIGYKKSFNKKFTIDSKITYNKDRIWFQYNFFNEDFFGVQQLESKAIDFTLDLFFKISSDFNVQGGFLYKSIFDIYNFYHLPSFHDQFFENTFIETWEDTIQSFAFYTQFSINPFKKLQLVGGLRFVKSLPYQIKCGLSYETDLFEIKSGEVKRTKLEAIPRIAAIYKFNNTNIFKLLYGQAIKNPSFFQDYLQIQSDEPTLFPEKIKTFEINYQSIFSSKYSLSLNLFLNTLDNLVTRLIILDETGNYDYSYNTNAGRMVTKGFELTFIAKPLETISIEFSGTLQKTEDKQTGQQNIPVAYSPDHLAYLKIRYDITEDITLALNGQFVGEMETLWDDSPDETKDYYSPLGRIGERTEDYFLTGFNFRYNNFIKKGVFLNLKISNLFDSEVRYPAFTSNSYADKGTLGYQRGFLLTLGWKF